MAEYNRMAESYARYKSEIDIPSPYEITQPTNTPEVKEHKDASEEHYEAQVTGEVDRSYDYIDTMKTTMQMIAIEQILDDNDYDAKQYGYMIDTYEAYLLNGNEAGAEKFMLEHEDFRNVYDSVTASYEGIEEYCNEYGKYADGMVDTLTSDEFKSATLDQQLGMSEGARLDFNTKIGLLNERDTLLFDYESDTASFSISELAQSAREQMADYERELGIENAELAYDNNGFNEIADQIMAEDRGEESMYATMYDMNGDSYVPSISDYHIDDFYAGLPFNMDMPLFEDEYGEPTMTYRDAMKESMFDDFADEYGFDYSYDDYLENPELFEEYDDLNDALTEMDDYCNAYNSAMMDTAADAMQYAENNVSLEDDVDPSTHMEARQELFTAYMVGPENDFLDTLNNNFPRAGGIAVDFEIERQIEVDDGISLMSGISEQDAVEINDLDKPLPESDQAILRDVDKTVSIGAIEPKQVAVVDSSGISYPGE